MVTMIEQSSTEFQKKIESTLEQINILESTEGWKQLTGKQQQLIKASFAIQNRAERGGTPGDNKAIIDTNHKGKQVSFISAGEDLVYNNELSADEEQNRKYKLSQEIVAHTFCQNAIQAVEQEYYSTSDSLYIPRDFFDADYLTGENYDALVARLKGFGFPCVVHICNNQNNPDKITQRNHSFIVLGTKGDDLIVWEKLTNNVPFSVSTLDQVKNMYPDTEFEWGIRTLRSANGEISTIKSI